MATNYNPDVLNCLANLSNDEVFTPPTLANQVLDLLPLELFKSADTKFLDPCTKSGVFLREIVKRLDRGLQDVIPDRQQRIDHILHNQVFGIACTELTALLSRRSVYCTKNADGDFSVSRFRTNQGNIIYTAIGHSWTEGRCKFCGASKEIYDRGTSSEQYAYQFIHTDKPSSIFDNMKFDVVVGNPPYQLSDGGAQASATPIYNLFIEQAKKLDPRYLSMIIPSRWFSGGKGLDEFRANMISDKRIRVLHDFLNSADCFGTGGEIKGGVCYFLWDRDNEGKCKIFTHDSSTVDEDERYLQEDNSDVFIRYKTGVKILEKVRKYKEASFMDYASSQKPFGLRTFAKGETSPFAGSIALYQNGGIGYIKRSDVERNQEMVDKYKIFISRAYNAGDIYPHQIIGKPILGEPKTCCTETYITIGPFKDKKETENVISYIRTKFFRFLVFLTKVSQMASAKVYQFVPVQDFSKEWTDKELYAKYGIDEDEQLFIDRMIRPME